MNMNRRNFLTRGSLAVLAVPLLGFKPNEGQSAQTEPWITSFNRAIKDGLKNDPRLREFSWLPGDARHFLATGSESSWSWVGRGGHLHEGAARAQLLEIPRDVVGSHYTMKASGRARDLVNRDMSNFVTLHVDKLTEELLFRANMLSRSRELRIYSNLRCKEYEDAGGDWHVLTYLECSMGSLGLDVTRLS